MTKRGCRIKQLVRRLLFYDFEEVRVTLSCLTTLYLPSETVSSLPEAP